MRIADGHDSEQHGLRPAGRRRSLFDPLGRIVDTVVPTVSEAVDVDDIVRRIDVDDLVRRVDVDDLVRRVDIDDIVRRIDIDALLGRVDMNALLDRIDVDRLLARVDLDAVIGRVDLDAIVDRIDIDRIVDRIDVDAIADRVDVNRVADRVDVDRVAARVDVEAIVDRVDVNQIADRVDVDRIVDRVDVDRIADRVDVDRVVQRADLAAVIADSTRGITASTLDLVRRQVVGVDEIITRVAARLVRRDPATDPDGPPLLIEPAPAVRSRRERPSISGHYAGPLARTAAFAIDWTAVVFLFGLFTAMGSWILNVLRGGNGVEVTLGPWWSALVFGGWGFVYFLIPMALTGRTLGKAVVGLRVVRSDGTPLHLRQAVVRVLVLPISLLVVGLGMVGAVFGRHRRTLHDLAGGSVEVIDWGDRPAALPTPLNNWLERRHANTTATR